MGCKEALRDRWELINSAVESVFFFACEVFFVLLQIVLGI